MPTGAGRERTVAVDSRPGGSTWISDQVGNLAIVMATGKRNPLGDYDNSYHLMLVDADERRAVGRVERDIGNGLPVGELEQGGNGRNVEATLLADGDRVIVGDAAGARWNICSETMARRQTTDTAAERTRGCTGSR